MTFCIFYTYINRKRPKSKFDRKANRKLEAYSLHQSKTEKKQHQRKYQFEKQIEKKTEEEEDDDDGEEEGQRQREKETVRKCSTNNLWLLQVVEPKAA